MNTPRNMNTPRKRCRSFRALSGWLALPILAGVMAAGCGEVTAPAPEPLDQLPRPLSAAERLVVAGSNAFAFELLKRVHAGESGPNVFLSPLSASMVLGMTLNGAAEGGETWRGMAGALGFDGMGEAEINAAYRELIALLGGLDRSVEFRIANGVFANGHFPFVPAFEERVRDAFDAEVRTLDFGDPRTKAEINAWAAAKTNNRIPLILERDLDPGADGAFLLNAIYFNGNWTDRFERSGTAPRPFRLADGTEVQVPAMSGRINANIRYGAGVMVGELLYGRRAFAMTIVVPYGEATLAEVLAGLDVALWDEWVGSEPAPAAAYRKLEVQLPKFELDYGSRLDEALMGMGMEAAFDPSRGFTRMIQGPGVHLSEVIQKTFVRVDEMGTEAAAVTLVGAQVSSGPPSLIVDRPFLVAIRERFSGTILFLGTIGDPR